MPVPKRVVYFRQCLVEQQGICNAAGFDQQGGPALWGFFFPKFSYLFGYFFLNNTLLVARAGKAGEQANAEGEEEWVLHNGVGCYWFAKVMQPRFMPENEFSYAASACNCAA